MGIVHVLIKFLGMLKTINIKKICKHLKMQPLFLIGYWRKSAYNCINFWCNENECMRSKLNHKVMATKSVYRCSVCSLLIMQRHNLASHYYEHYPIEIFQNNYKYTNQMRIVAQNFIVYGSTFYCSTVVMRAVKGEFKAFNAHEYRASNQIIITRCKFVIKNAIRPKPGIPRAQSWVDLVCKRATACMWPGKCSFVAKPCIHRNQLTNIWPPIPHLETCINTREQLDSSPPHIFIGSMAPKE